MDSDSITSDFSDMWGGAGKVAKTHFVVSEGKVEGSSFGFWLLLLCCLVWFIITLGVSWGLNDCKKDTNLCAAKCPDYKTKEYKLA